jgi:hypothetical protein
MNLDPVVRADSGQLRSERAARLLPIGAYESINQDQSGSERIRAHSTCLAAMPRKRSTVHHRRSAAKLLVGGCEEREKEVATEKC